MKELAKALNAAQIKFKPALKSADNPFFKSKYASLADIWDAVKEPLSQSGLSVSQTLDLIQGETVLVTSLVHISGEKLEGKVRVKPLKDDPQSWGSAITYFRRYSLAAILGVVTEDDDGAGASGTDNNYPARTQTPMPAPSSQLLGSAAEGFIIPVGRDKGKPLSFLTDAQLMENINYWKPRLDADRTAGKTVSQSLSNYMMALEEVMEQRITNAEQDIPL